MRKIIKSAGVIAALSLMGAQPAQACWNSASESALKIKHLNMMLMATALRCRNTENDFLQFYNAFVTKHNGFIGAQNALVKAELSTSFGPKAAVSVSDELTVGFANTYGAGHPNMDCGALKILAESLSSPQSNSDNLLDAADHVLVATQLPGSSCRTTGSVIARR